jgi:hypothetical protein
MFHALCPVAAIAWPRLGRMRRTRAARHHDNDVSSRNHRNSRQPAGQWLFVTRYEHNRHSSAVTASRGPPQRRSTPGNDYPIASTFSNVNGGWSASSNTRPRLRWRCRGSLPRRSRSSSIPLPRAEDCSAKITVHTVAARRERIDPRATGDHVDLRRHWPL